MFVVVGRAGRAPILPCTFVPGAFFVFQNCAHFCGEELVGFSVGFFFQRVKSGTPYNMVYMYELEVAWIFFFFFSGVNEGQSTSS